MSDNDNIDEQVSTLIDQLKDNNKITKKVTQHREEFDLSKEDVEQFIINNSGKLISESLDIIQQVKDYVAAGPESRDMLAYAELVKASSAAIESLNKLVIQDKKSETIVKSKTMDIEARKELQSVEHSHIAKLTREEVLKKLIEDSKIIEADVIEEPIKKIS